MSEWEGPLEACTQSPHCSQGIRMGLRQKGPGARSHKGIMAEMRLALASVGHPQLSTLWPFRMSWFMHDCHLPFLPGLSVRS